MVYQDMYEYKVQMFQREFSFIYSVVREICSADFG